MGCAARPEAIIDGIIKAVDILDKKYVEMKMAKSKKGDIENGE